MIVLGDVAVMLKMEIGYWIFTLVCRSMDYSQRYSVLCGDFFYVFPKQRYLPFFSLMKFFFVSQGHSVVVSREKRRLNEEQRRYLVIPDFISESSGQCGLFNLKTIPSCFGPRSCNHQHLTEYYFMPKK